MSDSTVHNLLVGSHDLSTALWFGKAKRSDKTFWGAAVADFDAKGGIYFPNDANKADARATSGAGHRRRCMGADAPRGGHERTRRRRRRHVPAHGICLQGRRAAVGPDRGHAGYTYTCAAGETVECRLEA